jgi:tetratricopeptide (TPR) repeat protein
MGRRLAQSGFSLGTAVELSADPSNHVWLYDLLCYGVYSAFGGIGLVLIKALLVAGLALVLMRLSTANQGWLIPAVCTALAVLAMGTRLLLQPATVSCLFLGMSLWLAGVGRTSARTSPWPLLILFAIWVNMDRWFVLGLATLALVWLGSVLDSTRHRLDRGNLSLVSLCVAAAACLLNPSHIQAFTQLPEWFAVEFAPEELVSPFQRAYVARFGLIPAGLAYFPLLGLGLCSFGLNLRHWRWQRFLPWLGLAALSTFNARTISFFAVIGGPVLAWNLQDLIARQLATDHPREMVWRRALAVGRQLTPVLLLLLVACAWPGWLQFPPYGPRRWAVEVPPTLERGAAVTERWYREGKLAADKRGLHLSVDSARAFAWLVPEHPGLVDRSLSQEILDAPSTGTGRDERLRAADVDHVIVYDSDAALGRLLAEPQTWPMLYMESRLAVFGWRDRYRGQEVDFDRLAFHPAADKKAPQDRSALEPRLRPWWNAFWEQAPARPIDSDEAAMHLFYAETLGRSSPYRHLVAWESSQTSSLILAAGGWSIPASSLLDGSIRLTLLRPVLPQADSGAEVLPPLDQIVPTLQRSFTWQRDDVPPASLYLALRAARRALAVNPSDAQAYLALGRSYMLLLKNTRERFWSRRYAELAELRRAQAIAALNQALALKPDSARAHLMLNQLYREMGYVDLELKHLRSYVQLASAAGPPPGVDPREFRKDEAGFQAEVKRMTKEVSDREKKFVVAAAGKRVLDRALAALQQGLAEKARDLLLESDIAAFGPQGMELELSLLLQTGRPKDVADWTGPEQLPSLGAPTYHRLRILALAALGDYRLAQDECRWLIRTLTPTLPGREPQPLREMAAKEIGWIVLEQQPVVGGTAAHAVWHGALQIEASIRIDGLIQSLKQEADLTVLRGLLALEQGDVEEAEVALRVALAVWRSETAPPSARGLDFSSRLLAQGYLHWLN